MIWLIYLRIKPINLYYENELHYKFPKQDRVCSLSFPRYINAQFPYGGGWSYGSGQDNSDRTCDQ